MRIVFFVIYLSISIGGFAQNDTSSIVPDSLTLGTAPHLPKKVAFFDKLPHGKLFNSTYIGAPLVIGGLIVKHQDKKFRKLRNDFMPQFHRTFDNYTQYAPAIVMVGMKAAGIESRSSWGRMLLGDAFSVSMMAGIVQGLKHTTSVLRPDGSNDHSFPSGHTATAFMTATMLNKEYGYKSPWIGFGAYSVATATGLMRIANNKHWLSDVMVGAGIGIMATEFGYWLADLIFKEKGLNRKDEDVADDDFDDECNSFLDLYMGFNLPLSDYDHYVDIPDFNGDDHRIGRFLVYKPLYRRRREALFLKCPVYRERGRCVRKELQLFYRDGRPLFLNPFDTALLNRQQTPWRRRVLSGGNHQQHPCRKQPRLLMRHRIVSEI